MASYPTSAKTYTTKNTGDTLQPAHVNDLQAEITAIESALLTGLAHHFSPAEDNTYDLGTDASRWRNLKVAGAATFAGTLAWGGGAHIDSSDLVPTLSGGKLADSVLSTNVALFDATTPTFTNTVKAGGFQTSTFVGIDTSFAVTGGTTVTVKKGLIVSNA